MMAVMSDSAISVAGLRKAFGDKVMLDGIDLDVAAGTITTAPLADAAVMVRRNFRHSQRA
jgi:hypothetical protein